MGAASTYYVYILASGRYGTLYIGVTNNLRTRLDQHRTGRGSEFVKNIVCIVSSMWKSSLRREMQSHMKSSSRIGTAAGKFA
jgi:predicted GIY-YIG superfamily endonuclease